MNHNLMHAHSHNELRHLTEGAYLLFVSLVEDPGHDWFRWYYEQKERYADVCRLCFLDALMWIAEGVLTHGVEPEQALRDQIASRTSGGEEESWSFPTTAIAAEFRPGLPIYPSTLR